MSPTTRLVGKTSAALGAATGQDLAAVGSSHSLAEAVDLLAVELLGLIGTFRCHVETPPVIIPGRPHWVRHLLDTLFFYENGRSKLILGVFRRMG